ncbi:hypothetical protein [Aliarcobacter butzleri]|uniref:hypothetical protein n=1 Tax=Aliarcobacter butzleri TaxID=28197 RepID=UPI002B240A6B|nr:hypothetical protein [Aliarcobacter butzleri]
MISNLKKILIIFSIFLTVVAFILLSNEKKQSILITEDILETKDLNIKHSQEEKNPKLFAKNLKELSSNNYEYVLSSEKFLDINISDNNIRAIKYVEFDENQLDGKFNERTNKLELKSSYEIVPGRNKLVVFYNDNTKVEFNLNIKYLYDSKIDEKKVFLDSWSLSEVSGCSTFAISNKKEVVLGGKCSNKSPISMQYKKNFDKDINLSLDFIPLKSNTIDMQLTFGERIYINFNNKRIEFKRKEYNEEKKKKEIIPVYSIEYDKFKNDKKYKINFSRKGNLYQLKIINNETKEIIIETNYIDDEKNKLEYEKYKNLRISVGSNNMKILVSRIEIF